MLLDANLLIYSHLTVFSQHRAAREWLDQMLTGEAPVGFPWESITAFLRIVTSPRIFAQPVPTGTAWQQVEEWLACAVAWIPLPTERHAALLRELLSAPGVRANVVPDAHLAALAIEHGLALCSSDGGFARFPRVRWINPLAS